MYLCKIVQHFLCPFSLVRRLIFSSAREGQFPAVMSGVHVKWGTPIAAIVLQVSVYNKYVRYPLG